MRGLSDRRVCLDLRTPASEGIADLGRAPKLAPAAEICEIGYINTERKHALISVRNPTLCNAPYNTGVVQVAITLSSAREMKAKFHAFLEWHAGGAHGD
jgi:hypothetical protein